MNSIANIAEESRAKLMKRLDFNGLQFYLFLPSFNVLFRKKLNKRIFDYDGQVNLAIKDRTDYVIVSDNVISYYIERNNFNQLKEYFKMPENNNSMQENSIEKQDSSRISNK